MDFFKVLKWGNEVVCILYLKNEILKVYKLKGILIVMILGNMFVKCWVLEWG